MGKPEGEFRGQEAMGFRALHIKGALEGNSPQTFSPQQEKYQAKLLSKPQSKEEARTLKAGKVARREETSARLSKESAQKKQHAADEKLVASYNQAQDEHLSNIVGFDLEAQFLPKLWQAIDKAKQNQVLETIDARIAQAEQAFNQSTALTNSEQVSPEQAKLEIAQIASQAPAELLVGGVAFLLLYIVRRIPVATYRTFGTLAILSIALAACGAAAGTPDSQTPTGGDTGPVAGETTVPNTEESSTAEAEQETNSPDNQAFIEQNGEMVVSDNPIAQQRAQENDIYEASDAFIGTLVEAGIVSREAIIEQFSNVHGDTGVKVSGGANSNYSNYDFCIVNRGSTETGYLFFTVEGAQQVTQSAVRIDCDGIAYDANNNKVARVSSIDWRWYTLNANGQMEGLPTPDLIPTPINPDPGNYANAETDAFVNETLSSFATRILAGEQINTSLLTLEQQEKLKAELAKQGEAQAKEIAQTYLTNSESFSLADYPLELANVVRQEVAELLQPQYSQEIVYTGDKQQKVCLDPLTLTMKICSEGTPELDKFQPIYAIQENSDGTFSYTDQWGETHKIVGLDKDDELHIVKDAQTDLIKWPETEKFSSGAFSGMSFPQAWLAESHTNSVPDHLRDGFYVNDIACLRPVLGQTYFDFNRGQPEPRAILECGKIIRDNNGTPLFLYKFLITPWNNSLVMYQEGGNEKKAVVNNGARDYIFDNIPANHMVWIGALETEISSSFHYAPQNTENWSDLALHTKEAVDFLQTGKLPKSKIPMLETVIVIFEANQE